MGMQQRLPHERHTAAECIQKRLRGNAARATLTAASPAAAPAAAASAAEPPPR